MASAEESQTTAEALLKRGDPLMAYDVLAEALREHPTHHRLRQLLALALARTGASREANRLLRGFVYQGLTDEETVGMLARTHKDLAAHATDEPGRLHHLGEAFRWYLQAYQTSGGYWSGINAATMALLLGERDESARLASAVRDECEALYAERSDGGDAYWLLATLGEAELLLGHREVAERRYRDAVSRGVGLGDRVSTRRNARLILRALHADASSLDAIFGVPRVGVFVGHLIDAPGRSSPRFPADMEADVHRAMKERLGRLGIGIGYASAASGGDILFLELLHEMGAETHVVLPYDREAFREDSVRPAGGNWSERYDAVLARAASVTTASEQRMLNGAMSYEYCFLLLDGTAAIKADELDTELACLALWDGRSGDGPGGTATSVAHWQRAGRYVEVIDAHAILASRPAPPASGRADGADVTREWAMPSTAFEAQIAGLLFADAFGFSKLSESQVPQFVEHFLGRVAGIVGQMTPQPRLSNTWGDGLYLVFDSVRQTGECALRLAEALRSEDWTRFGLPATLQLRIAVHAGPVYACTDPVTHRTNFIGAHVSHAARIEPVTPPGEVYASGAFAALARAENVASFACAYVGRTPLAKGYGTFPIYVLHRRT